MNIRKSFAILSSIIGAASIATPIAISTVANKTVGMADGLSLKSGSQQEATPSEQVTPPTNNEEFKHYYTQPNLETISSSSGPMVMRENGKIMTHYDWWGTEMWSVDVSVVDKTSTKIVDYDYLQSKDWLFLLTDKAHLIKINTQDGTILGSAPQTKSGIPQNANRIAGIEFNKSLYAWNSKGTDAKVIEVERNKLIKDGEYTWKNGSSSSRNTTNSSLIEIFPIAVGYNVGLFANKSVGDDDQVQGSELSLKFIDDNLVDISKPASSEKTTPTIDFTTSTQVKNISTYSFIRNINASTHVIIIDNDLYTVTLNKSDMSKSSIKKVEFNTQSTWTGNSVQPKPTQPINSAFVDSVGNVFFKEKGGKYVYKFDFNDKLSVHMDITQKGNTDLTNAVNKTGPTTPPSSRQGSSTGGNNNINNVQIFPVLNKDRTANIAEHMVFMDPRQELMVTSKSSYNVDSGNSTRSKSAIDISSSQSNRVREKMPSEVQASDFVLKNTEQVKLVENENIKFKSNDLTGELIAKADVTRKAWYDTNVLLSTIVTYDSKKSNIKPKEVKNKVKWMEERAFRVKFAKYSANQIVEKDLEAIPELIVFPNGDNNKSYFKEYSEKIAIKSRDNDKGQITLFGLISYVDRHNNYINYSLPDKTYQLNKKGNTNKYEIKFYGAEKSHPGIKNDQVGTVVESQPPIDINKAAEAAGNDSGQLKKMSNYLPSLIQSSWLSSLIDIEDGYIPSRRIMYISKYDDTAGTMTVIITYNGMDPKIPFKFVQEFTGFAKEPDATISFKGDEATSEEDKLVVSKFDDLDKKDEYLKDKKPKKITTIQGLKELENLVSDEIDANELGPSFATKLDLMGYKPNLKIVDPQTLDYEYGSIVLELDYTGGKTDGTKLKEPYYNKFGLKNGKIRQRYFGMLPISARYDISLDSNKANQIINKYNVDSVVPPNELKGSLSLKGFTIDEISIQRYYWDGEKLVFDVVGQSKEYKSVNKNAKLVIDWAPKFMGIRTRNTTIAVSVSVLGIVLVSAAVTIYILNRNRIRRMLK